MREERASPPDLCAASAKEYKTTMPQPKDDLRPYLSLTIKTSDLAVAVHLAVRKHRLYGIRGFKVWGFNGTDDVCRVDVRNVDHEAEETVAKWLSERGLDQYKPGFGCPEGTLLVYSSHTPIEDNEANRQAIINEVKEIMNKPIMGIVGAQREWFSSADPVPTVAERALVMAQAALTKINDYPKWVRDSIRPTVDALRELRDLMVRWSTIEKS